MAINLQVDLDASITAIPGGLIPPIGVTLPTNLDDILSCFTIANLANKGAKTAKSVSLKTLAGDLGHVTMSTGSGKYQFGGARMLAAPVFTTAEVTYNLLYRFPTECHAITNIVFTNNLGVAIAPDLVLTAPNGTKTVTPGWFSVPRTLCPAVCDSYEIEADLTSIAAAVPGLDVSVSYSDVNFPSARFSTLKSTGFTFDGIIYTSTSVVKA